MPANVLENMRPTLIAGFAKLVELVKKYAAPMERSPWVLTGQAAWFCSAPDASSQV